MRRIVIGDIHGCAKALRGLIEELAPQPADELIFLGDYVDRGPNSRDVIDQIIDLQSQCNVITLRGNHEIMLLGVTIHALNQDVWMRSGGQATITSYGGTLDRIPSKHIEFLQNLRSHYETEDQIFVHACYDPYLEMTDQDDSTIYWTHLPLPPPQPHMSGKRVFLGHTPQADGHVLNYGYLVCVDTCCFGGGFLTAMDVDDQTVIQTDIHGHVRRPPFSVMAEKIRGTRLRLSTFFRGLNSRVKRRSEQESGRGASPKPDQDSGDGQSQLGIG